MKKRPTKVMRETAEVLLPREKLLAGTTAAELTDQELLAVLLKTGTRDCNVLELAGRILKQFGSLYDLSIADWRELQGGYGLGIELKDHVILGVTDMTQDRRIVGHVAMVPTLDNTATFSMDIIKLIPREMSKVELYSILRYGGVSKEISQLATGATVLHLLPNTLDSVRVSVPDKKAFAKVEPTLSDCYIEADNLALQNRNLTWQRDRLLPRLMSGRLEV